MLSLRNYTVTSVLYEDATTRAYRGADLGSDVAVILKTCATTPADSRQLARLRREHALLGEIECAGIGRPHALVEHGQSLVLAQEDHGGFPLTVLIEAGPCHLATFFPIALALIDILACLHKHGVVHGDIKPHGILYNTRTGRVQMSDLGRASRLSREYPTFVGADGLEGHLAYMAPEQTGLMNRGVDYRADYYALGALFYELLVGQLPFTANDALEWVHCHIARPPRPPNLVVTGLPVMLSRLVLKLLAKLAEDRYQSAAGLRADLLRVQHQWNNGQSGFFELGRLDISDRLQLPQKLYGREREIATLRDCFGRVASSGETELVLVSGYSGIGKSSLVAELYKSITAQRGYFIAGKFDQYKRGIPYAAVADAFRALVQQLLTESEQVVEDWRQHLLAALAGQGALIVDLIPQVALVIGPQALLPELPPEQAQHRTRAVLQKFIRALATAEHPLVLFLDDLQWVDPASLDLIQQVSTAASGHLLLIGAYRDNEVGQTHPLAVAIDDLRRRPTRISTIQLAPLADVDVRNVLADTLHCNEAHAAPLAHLIFEKTRGNPFFCFQFMTALYQDQLLAFDHDQQIWKWDLNRIELRGFTDNVVDLMVGELKRLPPWTQDALQVAGFLGNQFELATLAQVTEKSVETTEAELWPALQVGLVIREGDACRFLHDRVQEAAYSLTHPSQRAARHLRIGRLLRERMSARGREDNLFTVANHLNLGSSLISDAGERSELASLNLAAGSKAKKATVYAAASGFLAAGVDLLPADAWTRDYALTFALHLERAECEYLSGQIVAAEDILDGVLANATDAIDRAKANLVRIRILMSPGDHWGARRVGMVSLAELGVDFPAVPTSAHVERAYAEFDSLMAGRPIEALIDTPMATNPSMRMAIELMVWTTTATYFSDPLTWALHVPTMALLNLRHGHTEHSPMAYTFFGFELAGGRQRYREGYRFCQVAFALMERLGQDGNRGNILTHTAFTACWTRPLDEVLAMLAAAVPACLASGDLIMASTATHHEVIESWVRSEPLVDALKKADRCLALSAEVHYETMVTCILPRRQLIQQLRGLTSSPMSLSDADFDETAFEHKLAGDRIAMGVCYYHLARQAGAIIFNDYAAADAAARRAEPLLWSTIGTLSQFMFVFFDALSLAANFPQLSHAEQPQQLLALNAHQAQLRIWVDGCVETFEASYLLVSAEIARICGHLSEAMGLYDRAIASARRGAFLQHEALANELAAQFYRLHGVATVSDMYLRAAHDAYARWGAEGKLRQLESAHPHLHAGSRPAPAGALTGGIAHLDAIAIRKAAQAISGEIMGDSLRETLLEIMLEQAGAQFAALLLMQADALLPAGIARVVDARIEVDIHREGGESCIDLPEAVLTYVRRSRERILVDDARALHPFANDPYLLERRPASFLCVPILRKGELVGVVYLEHATIPGVFTSARLDVLDQLVTQAAIALENAQLYARLENEGRRFRALYDENPSIYFTLGADGVVQSVNSFGAQQLGYRGEELVGRRFAEFFYEDDRRTGEQFVAKALAETGELSRWELRKVTRSGALVWMRETARAIDAGDGSRLLLIVSENTTEAWKLSEELQYQATHDELTGLANRREFERRLTATVESIESAQDRHALCYFDLDQFKIVNDACGHIAGDELLRQLAVRIGETFRRQDVIARLGGDEFAVLMEHVSVDESLNLARRLLDEIRAFRFVWEGRHFPIGVSIGLMAIDDRNAGQQVIMGAADTACYLAKEKGGNRIHVHDDGDLAAAQRSGQLLWVPRINEALAEDRFFLVYQPIMPLRSGLQDGEHIELLLRLRERDGRVVSPAEFLPAVERYQLAGTIDIWVITTALAWLTATPARLQRVSQCSINVSGRSLGDVEFQQRLYELLARTSVPMHVLCFEITETAAITSMEQALQFINLLKARGCRFALDDFGSGLASFFYLKVLPVDYVKIDGVFVKDMLDNPFDLALVRSIAEVARAGGMLTIGEFAHNQAVIESLRDIGVDYAQGYGIAMPKPITEF